MPGRPQRRIPSSVTSLGRTDTLTKGAQKALGNFINEYGKDRGVGLFLAKAEERGKGNTLRQKVNFTYKKGARIS